MQPGIDWLRLVFIVGGVIPAALLLYIGPSRDAVAITTTLRAMITIFAFLAGFLIAVISLVSDPKGLYRGNWRVASAHHREIAIGLSRLLALFYVYLISMLLGFLAILTQSYCPGSMLAVWAPHVAVCCGLTALCWSFGLPLVVYRMQMDRLDDQVEHRQALSHREPSSSR